MCSRSRRWPVVALALAVACIEKTTLEPGPAVVAVHAVLNPAERVQHVMVRRAADGLLYGSSVSGAVVSLVTPDGVTLRATEVNVPPDTSPNAVFGQMPGPRYDVATEGVVLGKPYRLRVVLPSGEVVEGEATAPMAPPTAIASDVRLDRNADTLRLAWPRVAGARAYEVRVIPKRDSLSWYGEYVTYVDTSITLAGAATTHDRAIFRAGVRYDLVVSAVDANYYAYYGFDSEHYTGTALPTALRGAQGVFGAIAPLIRMSIAVEGVNPGLQ